MKVYVIFKKVFNSSTSEYDEVIDRIVDSKAKAYEIAPPGDDDYRAYEMAVE